LKIHQDGTCLVGLILNGAGYFKPKYITSNLDLIKRFCCKSAKCIAAALKNHREYNSLKVLQDWLASNKNEGFTDGGSKGCMLALEELAGCRCKLKRFYFIMQARQYWMDF